MNEMKYSGKHLDFWFGCCGRKKSMTEINSIWFAENEADGRNER